MIAGLMTYGLIIGAVIAGAALLLERAARVWHLPRRWIWAGALALLVTTVATAPQRNADSRWKLEIDNGLVTSTADRAVSSSAIDARALMRMIRERASAPVELTLRTARSAISPRLDRWMGVLWVASSLAALGTIVAVLARFRRARAAWPVAELHGDTVRVAPDGGPAVIGLARPEIVIPQWLLGCSAVEQQLVLAHEREHVSARDHLLLFAGCSALALMPWNPAVWWLLSRLRLAVELDCDARVLRRGVAPRSYGSLLIDLAGRCTRLPVGAPALADESSHLEQRLIAMKPTVVRFASLRSVAFGALALLGLVAACESRLPTSAEVESMDVASAELQMKKVLPFIASDSGDILYVIDGTVSNEKTIRTLTPDQIATIEVARGEAEEATVSVTTRAFVEKHRMGGDTTGSHFRLRTPDPSQPTFEVELDGNQTKAEMRRFDGIVMIDGKVASEGALSKLDPDRILTVEVAKGDAAAALYPELRDTRKGIIRITTRK